MSFTLTTAALHAMMPHAPAPYIEAMAVGQSILRSAGILDSINRCAYLFANAAEESAEFGPTEITENIHYTPARACAVWPSRFHSVGDVYAKVGSWPGDPAFATKLMDNVYGDRMGNRPGTHDGSEFIGRGGLQLTGRDEYAQLAQATGLDLVAHPELSTLPENQDPIMAAYVKIRNLNRWADAGNFTQYVRTINGGTIGMSTRLYYLSHMLPIVTALSKGTLGSGHTVEALQQDLNTLSGAGLTVDGKIGDATTTAVLAFQKLRGITPADGIPGPITWSVIDSELKAAA